MAAAHAGLAAARVAKGDREAAIGPLGEAIRLDPGNVTYQMLAARTLQAIGRPDEAADHARKVLELAPEHTDAMLLLADVSMARGDVEEAKSRYRSVLALKPEQRAAANNLAWLLATKGDGVRDAAEAVSLAETACRAAESSALLDTLAIAYASAGRFDAAVRAAERGIELARRENNPKLAREINARLPAYRAKRLPPS